MPGFDALADIILAISDDAASLIADLQGLALISGDIATLTRGVVRLADAFALAATNAGEAFTAIRAVEGSPGAIADVADDGVSIQTELPDRSNLFSEDTDTDVPARIRQDGDTPEVTIEQLVAGDGTSDREVGRRVGREVERALKEKRRDQGGGTSG